jgi:hypothetical protein
MPKVEMPKVELPKMERPKVEMPKVDVAAMTTQARGRVTYTAKNVQGSVTHAVALMREAVGL